MRKKTFQPSRDFKPLQIKIAGAKHALKIAEYKSNQLEEPVPPIVPILKPKDYIYPKFSLRVYKILFTFFIMLLLGYLAFLLLSYYTVFSESIEALIKFKNKYNLSLFVLISILFSFLFVFHLFNYMRDYNKFLRDEKNYECSIKQYKEELKEYEILLKNFNHNYIKYNSAQEELTKNKNLIIYLSQLLKDKKEVVAAEIIEERRLRNLQTSASVNKNIIKNILSDKVSEIKSTVKNKDINSGQIIFCPRCGFKFIYENSGLGKISGGLGGVISGAILGSKFGIAGGPLGAIAGTIPGAILGGIFGKNLGNKVDKTTCPSCNTKFEIS